jgi:hypothetical protein
MWIQDSDEQIDLLAIQPKLDDLLQYRMTEIEFVKDPDTDHGSQPKKQV